MYGLEIPASCHVRALCIVDNCCLEEVPLVSVGILESVEVLVWIGYSLWIEWIYSEHRETLIGKPTSISFSCLSVDSWYLVAEDVLGPLDLLLYCHVHHRLHHLFIIDIWELTTDLLDDVREYRHMCELVTTDIGNHTTSCWHLHVIHQCIEECESIVEVDRFEEEVGNDSTEEARISRIVYEVLIYLTDVGIAFEEYLVLAPEVVYLIAFLR